MDETLAVLWREAKVEPYRVDEGDIGPETDRFDAIDMRLDDRLGA